MKTLPLFNVFRYENIPPRMTLLTRIFDRRWIRHRGKWIFSQVLDIFVIDHCDANARVGRIFATAPLQLCLPCGRGTAPLVLFGCGCEQALALMATVSGAICCRRRRWTRQLWWLIVIVASVQCQIVISVIAVLCWTICFIAVIGLLFGVTLFTGHGRFVRCVFVLSAINPCAFVTCERNQNKNHDKNITTEVKFGNN